MVHLGFGQVSNCNLQLVILSLWGIRSVTQLANICLGKFPDLICWQWIGLKAPICCYLDSTLPGRSGLSTPPEAWLSSPASFQPGGVEVRETYSRKKGKEDEGKRSEGCLRMPLRFSIGARRGLFGMTECLADLAGKPTQMWGWDGCRVAEGGCKWWMAVVRRSNCVQVIDPTPSPLFCSPRGEPSTPSLFHLCSTDGRKHQQRETGSVAWQQTW